MIKKALKQMYDSMLWVGFATAKPWYEFGVDFSEYFDADEKEVRAGSALAFFGMLEGMYQGSCNAFFKNEDVENHNVFEVYLVRFLGLSETIRKEFPNIYVAIVSGLVDVDGEKSFEERFPEVDAGLFEFIREKFFSNDFVKLNPESYENALKEAGLSSDYM